MTHASCADPGRPDAGQPQAWIAIPARNEADLLPSALFAARQAVITALDAGVISTAVISLVVHRSTDRTQELADAFAAMVAAEFGSAVDPAAADGVAKPRLTMIVSVDDDAGSPGAVRTLAIEAAQRAGGPVDPTGVWIFSTDADSTVPADWITGTLAAAGPAVALVGMVELADGHLGPKARARHDEIVRRGAAGGRDRAAGEREQLAHDHVYGANLAVRLDAYLAVGGFSDLPHGEDHELIRRLIQAGVTILCTLTPRVRTSDRTQGRATGGLADLLARLESE